jgi:hypothetical protein
MERSWSDAFHTAKLTIGITLMIISRDLGEFWARIITFIVGLLLLVSYHDETMRLIKEKA